MSHPKRKQRTPTTCCIVAHTIPLYCNIIKIMEQSQLNLIRLDAASCVVLKRCDLAEEMKVVVCFAVLQVCRYVASEIRDSVIMNKLTKVKPVGGVVGTRFLPLTELPPLNEPHLHADGRRHLDPDCDRVPEPKIVYEGAKVGIFGDYYDDRVAKTVATVIIPDHIDRKHFEVTTQVPYLTVGPVEALGYHPTTLKSVHPSECEKIYQDHVDNEYTEEATDLSEESLEMARMPLFPNDQPPDSAAQLERLYSDY